MAAPTLIERVRLRLDYGEPLEGDEAAAYLGCSREHLDHLTLDGMVTAIEVTGCRRVWPIDGLVRYRCGDLAVISTAPSWDRVDQGQETMSAAELADYLGVNVETIYRQVEKGRIPGCQRIGKTLRFHWPSIVDWLSNGKGVSHP